MPRGPRGLLAGARAGTSYAPLVPADESPPTDLPRPSPVAAADDVAVVLCADGAMAGEEVPVPATDGVPPSVITVGGLTYLQAVQSRPVAGRPWRYTVARPNDRYVVDGGASQA
jgi:hypothetical protein